MVLHRPVEPAGHYRTQAGSRPGSMCSGGCSPNTQPARGYENHQVSRGVDRSSRFHRGRSQETLLPRPARLGVRRRPFASPGTFVGARSTRCGGDPPGVRPAEPSGIGCFRSHGVPRPRRLASRQILRAWAGTIFPSGLHRAIASLGPSEGHGLSVGTPPCGTNGRSDAHLRPLLATGPRPDRSGERCDRSVCRCGDRCSLLGS
jgi:hypothetical protein